MSSKLIENYLANPGLNTALKLIGHDPMMIFYFIECKETGLYTRQRKAHLETAAGSETRAPSWAESESGPKNPSGGTAVSMDPQSTPFPNVISTLMYDYQEISNQIEEYRSRINRGEVSNYHELIKHYEAGLQEFEAAIKVLQQYRKDKRE
ncbi:hypothetical protein LJK87_13700 [Paenibacillus sp. P25]|nr:hypothetical protein LJK87_13700 [Paenibacillus sp. P25]